MPRYFFFGLCRVQMYEWYWGHTAAQIELIDTDAPMLCYEKRDSHNGGLKPSDKGYKPDAKKLERTVQDWKRRKAEREARGFNFDAFLNTGELIPTKDG